MSLSALKVLLISLLILVILPSHIHASFTPAATQSANLNVSLRVNPKPSHFQFLFNSDLINSTAGADQEITYTITYGSRIDYGTPMVIKAQWSLGTVREENLTNYEILSYVAGSATKDYWGQSTPVVDIKHRTITWTITRFPPNTIDKTLSFKLRTPGRYVTDKQVNFTVTASMRTEQIDVGSITLDQTYNPSEFIRKEVSGLRILSADIRKITDTSFSLYLVTSVPAKTIIYLGLDPNNLDQIITDDNLLDQKIITVTGLLPATTYYFRILIENEKGIQRKTPELFVVTTAAHSIISRIDTDRLTVLSKGVSVKKGYDTDGNISILVPSSKAVDIAIPFYNQIPAVSYISIGGKNVLGATTTEMIPDIAKMKLLETEPGVITGRFSSPREVGTYDLILEASDLEGTTNQDVLATITVSPPITVLNSYGKPVEKALVYVERYNLQTKSFDSFPAQSYGSKNPLFTSNDGSTDLVLPLGEYTVNVNALGYEPVQEHFILSYTGTQLYPVLYLRPAPFNLINVLKYYQVVWADWISFVLGIVADTGSSARFMDLSLLVGLIILTGLSTLLNLRRIKFSLEGTYIYLEKKIRRIFNKRSSQGLFIGFIEDKETEMPIHNATILLIRRDNRAIVGRDLTSALGEFHIHIDPAVRYELLIKKLGYGTLKIPIDASILLESIPAIQMEHEMRVKLPPALEFVEVMLGSIFHGVSDSLLIGVLIFNTILAWHMGIITVLPVVIVSIINLLLWLEYHWVRFKQTHST